MLVLIAGFGKDARPIIITGDTVYQTREACVEQARIIVNWLTQDGVKVGYQCYPLPKVARRTE
jgi:hypothetical protein